MRIILIFILSVDFTGLFAQVSQTFGIMGGNLALQCNQFSMANNPGHLPESSRELGMLARNRFAGTEIVQGGLAGHLGLKNTRYGLQMQFAGTQWFSRAGLLASISQRITEMLNVGISAGMIQSRQNQFKNSNHLLMKLGFQYRVSEKISVAGLLQNPWRIKYRLDAELASGHVSMEYRQNRNTRFYLHAKNRLDEDPVLGLALKHAFSEKFEMMIGGQTGIESIHASVAFSQKGLRFWLGSSFHNYLGFSPCLGISCLLK